MTERLYRLGPSSRPPPEWRQLELEARNDGAVRRTGGWPFDLATHVSVDDARIVTSMRVDPVLGCGGPSFPGPAASRSAIRSCTALQECKPHYIESCPAVNHYRA
ncbi:uncharacterized protein LOC125760203 [Rhipicephalus sanguineus]|uniref:uncharacterized protein LOC125760203 n=1 Tax=Rhipicephalus sanguineus TaxID=34632 RepID=UPI0020C5089A|nr:uncharacterized protein LOC125760203 [Rhipicephalus sanguineus]